MRRRLVLGLAMGSLWTVVSGGIPENTADVSDNGDVEKPLLGNYNPSTMSPVDPLPWSILAELFPNSVESLSKAWEVEPTYLPGSPKSAAQDTILTAVPPSVPSNVDRFAHLFQLRDLAKVLADPDLIHGKDYAVLKYIQRDGEEWSGKFPYEKIPLEHIEHLVNEREFSVVINSMQKKWLPIAKFAKQLELETQCWGVSCNLYLTPPSGARGFECHLDWMDVIVVQVIGEKDWSVWTDPLLKTVVPDEKRKPTQLELKEKAPASVRLKPGDALYIPRGYMHNATTPEDSDSVSLHLTFGIEHLCQTTMEALLHHALELFVKQQDESSQAESIAIPVSSCVATSAGGNSITLNTLLHLAVSAVVRRTHCGGYGEVKESTRGTDNAAICSLRKSAALHPQFQQLEGRSMDDMKDKYVAGLEAVAKHLSARSAVELLNMVTGEPDPLANAGKYCFPHHKWEDFAAHPCNPDAVTLSIQRELEEFATKFVEFARRKFPEAQQQMMDDLNEFHVERWR